MNFDLSVVINIFYYGVVFGLSAAFLAIVISPLQYIKIMRQELLCTYGSIAQSSYKEGGCKVFFRGCVAYAFMQFMSSFSFGFAEALSESVLSSLNYGLLATVAVHACLGGVLETIATINFEIREIIDNKGDLAIGGGLISEVATIITLRNILSWSAPVAAYEVAKYFGIAVNRAVIMSAFFGLIVGMLTTPLDVLATRNCGSERKHCLWREMYVILFKSDVDKIFAGATVRITQIILYTAQTTLMEFLLTHF